MNTAHRAAVRKSKWWLVWALFFPVLLSIETPASSLTPDEQAPFHKRSYRITRTAAKIVIDGVLEEEAWQQALSISLDYEISPGENTPPPVKTECLLLYDRSNIYIAFRAEDPQPANIRAHFSDRDQIWQDDKVGVVLDTFNDQNRGFAFVVNPLGIQRDLIYSNGGSNFDDSWDAIWESAGRITDFGYVVEMAIPFNSLQFQRSGGEQTWGFELLRGYPREQHYWMKCYPDDRDEECLLCKYPRLTGLTGMRPGKNIELGPTLTGLKTDVRDDLQGGALKRANSNIEAGLSGRWGFTNNLTLSGAVNPDFSQVEADAAQLDINKQFALYYPEKRPFFLEGLDFFQTPLEAVYTRTLADPDWGIKLSGKAAGNAVGVFVVQDKMTNLLFPGAEESYSASLAQRSYAAVLRYRRDIGASSTLGILVTDREGQSYHNRIAGVDGLFRISRSDQIVFQFLGSHTSYPADIPDRYGQNEQDFSGTALYLAYKRNKRSYFWGIEYDAYSPGFRADLGFMPQVDLRHLEAWGGYTYWGKRGSLFSKAAVMADLYQTEDYHRRLIEKKAGIEVAVNGPLLSFLLWEWEVKGKVFNGVSFNQSIHHLTFQIKPSGSFNVNIYGVFGDEIDYAHTRAGEVVYVRPEILLNFGRHLNLVLSHSIEHLNVDDGRLFSANLTQLRLIYHFNERALIRGILQYTDIERDMALYGFEVDPRYRRLFSQFLFSYKINPRTVLFLGYTDNSFGYIDIPLTRANRTFFLKIGYALSL